MSIFNDDFVVLNRVVNIVKYELVLLFTRAGVGK